MTTALLEGDALRQWHNRFLIGEVPPAWVIERARRAGALSPCAKSQRGVALYAVDGERRRVGNNDHWMVARSSSPDANPSCALANDICVAAESNGPPGPFVCTGDEKSANSWRCRQHCAKLAVHAEQRAIMMALTERDVSMQMLELVHVKVVDEAVVPGGGPSCWQCSRLVVEVGLKGVWLYQATKWHSGLRCRECRKITIVAQGGGTSGVCAQCTYSMNLLDLPGKTIYDPTSGVWKFWSANDFHAETLRACGMAPIG